MERGKLTEYELSLRKDIALNLNKYARELRMTQKDLSKATKIPQSTISDYFNAKSLAVPGNVEKIARAFGVQKEQIDPSFGKAGKDLKEDPKMQFFMDLERELGIDLSDPEIQKTLKRAAKIVFTDED